MRDRSAADEMRRRWAGDPEPIRCRECVPGMPCVACMMKRPERVEEPDDVEEEDVDLDNAQRQALDVTPGVGRVLVPPSRYAFDGVVHPSLVVAATAASLGSTVEDVTGGRRFKGSIRARHAAALALRRLGLSYPEIAVVIRWGDHSTAHNAVRCAEGRVLSEPAFAAAVEAGVAAGRAGR